MITWDEPKRRENVRKHKIDLADLEPVFDSPMITVEDTRAPYGERGDETAHLISCRYANRTQTEAYFSGIQPQEGCRRKGVCRAKEGRCN